MLKYQVNFRTAGGWQQTTGIYETVTLAEMVADWIGKDTTVQTVLISRIWIPRTEVK